MYHLRCYIVLIAVLGLFQAHATQAGMQLRAPSTTATTAVPLGTAAAIDTCVPSAATASIAGTVRAPDNTPIQDVYAVLYTLPSGRVVKASLSDSTGAYTLTNLPAGNYLIQFDTRASGTAYASEWYDNQPSQASSAPIALPEGAALTSIDATLAVGAQITGRVTAGDTGKPLADTTVAVYDSDENRVTIAVTNASGIYTTTGLITGSYTVFFNQFVQPYLGEYYNDKPDLASATRLALTAPTVRSGVDAVLARGAQIAGRVTAADTGLGVPSAIAITGSSQGNTIYSITDDAGNYTTTEGFASDTYQFIVRPLSEISDYLVTEKTVSVSAPNVLDDTNIALELGGRVTGRITDASMAPLKFADVSLSSETTHLLFQLGARTDAAGNYTIHGVPSGSYTVFFSHSSSIGEYYNNQHDITLANRINVTAPQATSGIDAVLARGGTISGRVTAADTGLGLDDVSVDVYDLAGNQIDGTLTQGSGFYAFTTLPSGAYRVHFNPTSNGNGCAYSSEYYNNQRTAAHADTVSVTAPNTTPNINAELERGSTISGRVTAAGTGVPLPAVRIGVYDSQGEIVTTGITAANGTYTTAGGLPSGTYRLYFQPSGASADYASEFYNDQASLIGATPIVVQAPTNVTGIDAVLAKGGQIAGTVIAEDTDAGLPGVAVQVYDSGGNLVALGQTTASGAYIAEPALANGAYRVRFVPTSPGGQYSAEYYDDQPTLASATPIAISTPTIKTGIDAALSKGAPLSVPRTIYMPSILR
jgi:hypothetical protein